MSPHPLPYSFIILRQAAPTAHVHVAQTVSMHDSSLLIYGAVVAVTLKPFNRKNECTTMSGTGVEWLQWYSKDLRPYSSLLLPSHRATGC